MATEDRAARFEALMASIRDGWLGRQIPPEYDWQTLARHAADGLQTATAPTVRRFASVHVVVAIMTALDALDRLEAEDAADRSR